MCGDGGGRDLEGESEVMAGHSCSWFNTPQISKIFVV